MQIINIHDTKTHFSKLIEQVQAGKTIVIGKGGKPVAKLVPYEAGKKPFEFGQLEGKIYVSDNFNETDTEVESLFYAGDSE